MDNIEKSINELLSLDRDKFFQMTLYLKDNCRKENIPDLKRILLKMSDDDKKFYLSKLITHLENNALSLKQDNDVIDLDSAESRVRLQGLKNIINKRNMDYIEEVRRLISNDHDINVVSTSIAALKFIGDKSDIPLILPFLRHVDDGIKATTIETLEAIGDQECLKYIIPLADSEHNKIRINCLKTLWKYGQDKVIEEIGKMINTRNTQLLGSIIYVLGEMKSEKSRELLDRLLDKDLDSRLHEKIKEKLVEKNDALSFSEKLLNNVKVSYIRTREDRFFLVLTVLLLILTAGIVLWFSPGPAKQGQKNDAQIIAECLEQARKLIENGEINKSINFLSDRNKQLKSPEIFEYLGNILFEFQRHEEARKYYLEVIHSGREPDEYLLNRIGEVYQKTGDNDTALEYFAKAVQRNGKLYHAYNNMGDVYFNLGNIGKAVECFKAARSNGGENDPVILNNLGYCYFKTGHDEQALEHYRKALSLKSDHIETLNNLAILQIKRGETEKASGTLKKIISISPTDPAALDSAKVLKIISERRSTKN